MVHNAKPREIDALIVGAGFAGITAAEQLSKNLVSINVLTLEVIHMITTMMQVCWCINMDHIILGQIQRKF